MKYINFADPPSKQAADINENFEEAVVEPSYMPEAGTIPVRSEAIGEFTGGRLKASPGTDPDDCVTVVQLELLEQRVAALEALVSP
mgnify:CR=1 FL=1